MRTRLIRYGGFLVAALLFAGLHASSASALSLEPNLVLSGVPNSNYPNGGGTLADDPFPWLTVEVSTVGSGGAVTVSGTASVPAAWWHRSIYLNIAGLETTLSDAVWSASSLTCSDCAFTTLSVASNAHQAAGAHDFDVLIGFENPEEHGTPWNRFSGNDTFSFTLTCGGDADCAGFNAESFNVLTAANGFRIAALLQGLPSTTGCAENGAVNPTASCNSAWIAGTDPNATETQEVNPETTVPEPASLALLGAGLVGMVAATRRRRSQ